MNNTEEEFYKQKYLKYKAKYLEAKFQMAGKPGKELIGKFGIECTKDLKGNKQGYFGCLATPGCKWEERGKNCIPKRCQDYSGVGAMINCTTTPGCTTEGLLCRPKRCNEYILETTCPNNCAWHKPDGSKQGICIPKL